MKFIIVLLLVTLACLIEAKKNRSYLICVPASDVKTCNDKLKQYKGEDKVTCISSSSGNDCLHQLQSRAGGDLIYVNDAINAPKGYNRPPPPTRGSRYKRQLDRETCQTIAVSGGQYGGGFAGAAAGAAIGSVIPGIGTAIGSIVGFFFGTAGGTAIGAVSTQAC